MAFLLNVIFKAFNRCSLISYFLIPNHGVQFISLQTVTCDEMPDIITYNLLLKLQATFYIFDFLETSFSNPF